MQPKTLSKNTKSYQKWLCFKAFALHTGKPAEAMLFAAENGRRTRDAARFYIQRRSAEFSLFITACSEPPCRQPEPHLYAAGE